MGYNNNGWIEINLAPKRKHHHQHQIAASILVLSETTTDIGKKEGEDSIHSKEEERRKNSIESSLLQTQIHKINNIRVLEIQRYSTNSNFYQL